MKVIKEKYKMELIKAHNRNLKITLLYCFCKGYYTLNQEFSKKEIHEKLYFRTVDLQKNFENFFEVCNDKYVLKNSIKRELEFMEKKHKKFIPELKKDLDNIWNLYLDFKKNIDNYNYKPEIFEQFLESIKPKLEMIHWVFLPIYEEEVMKNENSLPEENIEEYYNNYYTVMDLFKWIENENKHPSLKGDCNLDKEVSFRVFSRRWGHYDNYRIKRTIDGWYAKHLSINGPTKKDGTGALLNNLDHDYIVYPVDGIKHALETLWNLADKQEMPIDELEDKLAEIADWISAVEKTVGEYQPEWCNYY